MAKGVDSPSKLRAMKEQFEKFEGNFQIVESFRPNPNIAAVTAKFYARHESFDLGKADQDMLDIIYYLKKDIKEKMDKPDSTNHSYGWYSKPLVPINRNDRRYYCPIPSNENTKTMLLLAKDRSLKRPKFTGIPFKL